MSEQHGHGACLAWSEGLPQKKELQAGQEFIIGRDPGAALVLGAPLVSWHHAHITVEPGSCVVRDLGATNGTSLNGNPLQAHQAVRFSPGDVLSIGEIDIHYVTGAQIASSQNGQQGGTQFFDAPFAKELLIGRTPSADIFLDHPDVSRHHARLHHTADGWVLTDLDSANGTFVNNKRITQCVVQSQDRIQIGLHRLAINPGGVAVTNESQSLHIAAHGLWRTVSRNGQAQHLLQDVSLHIAPRQLVAIVGASGAGKSTLLRALNGYVPADTGRVLINGIDLYNSQELLQCAIGYVPQDDIVHRELTVQSALNYAARLRLPGDVSDGEIAALVAGTLADLNLIDRRESPIHTLSGGERKRVNIGVELLTRPSALFLDEPTTGLDAGLERRITLLLRELANQGRTVVVVTHSASTLEQYDQIAFLARGGRLVFFGPPAQALAHFGVSDFAEIYEILNRPDVVQRYAVPGQGAAAPAPAVRTLPVARPRTGWFQQLQTLLLRYAEIIGSDKRFLLFWLAQAPFIGVLIALLFQSNVFIAEQVTNAAGEWPIHSAPRLLFLMAFSLSCFGLCNASREIVKERSVYERERHVGLRNGPYVVSKFVLLTLVAVVQCVVLLGIVALKIPFHLDGGEVVGLLLLLALGAANAILLALIVSALSSTAEQAMILIGVLILLQVLFSGFIPLQQLPEFMHGLVSLCSVRWSYGGLCGLLELESRWNEVGLGRWLDDVMRTPPRQAIGVLLLLAGVKGAVLWGVLEGKERFWNRR